MGLASESDNPQARKTDELSSSCLCGSPVFLSLNSQEFSLLAIFEPLNPREFSYEQPRRNEMPSSQAICIYTTTETAEQAGAIAHALVEKRLAACVQVQGPIRSTYWWQGKIDASDEWLCVAKSTEEKYAEAEAAIRSLHSYDEPEVIAVPIVAGSASYLDWLRKQTSTGE